MSKTTSMANLSRPAQTVLDAFESSQFADAYALALALRAAADLVVPEEQEPVPDEDSVLEMQIWAGVSQRQRTRSQLLAIADELEGTAEANR